MAWTKDDYAAYRRRHRLLYLGKQAVYNRERRRVLRAVLDALKDQPCADCKVRYPPHVMDFDHVRGECDVVCSNCHRIRTHKRGTSIAGALKGAKARWNL